MLFTWFIPLLIDLISVAAIVVMVIPFPFSLRYKIALQIQKYKLYLFGVIGICIAYFVQEFTEQAKFVSRRREAVGDSQFFFAAQQFRHQRNMYIIALTVVMVAVVYILSKMLKDFLGEQKLLKEQLAVRQQLENNRGNQENAPAAEDHPNAE